MGLGAKRLEFIDVKPYQGHGEAIAVLLGCSIWFMAILTRLSLAESGDWMLVEKLFEASSFLIFAAIPIFGLATHAGEQWAKQRLLPHQGLGFQGLVCGLLAVYLSIGQALPLKPEHFGWVRQLNHLVVPNHFGLNLFVFLGGVFVALRLPFLALALRQVSVLSAGKSLMQQIQRQGQFMVFLGLNTLYLSLKNPANSAEGFVIALVYLLVCVGMNWPGWKQRPNRLMPFDFGLMVLCAAIIYWFSTPSFNFGVFIAVDLFILVLVYGTGLGREHFGYSFQLRPSDWRVLVQTVVIATFTLVPLALLSGFVQPEWVGILSPPKLLSYFALFTLRVGLFEEIFFRSGLMVLIRDQLLDVGRNRLSPQKVAWLSVCGCSLLFGLVHIGNEAGSTSTLVPWQYKSLYILLATTASLFYATAFAQTNRLSPSILIHGFVDTTAVILLGGFLAIPF